MTSTDVFTAAGSTFSQHIHGDANLDVRNRHFNNWL